MPLERDDGDAILVDRGWVPDKRPRPIAQAEGDVTLEGYVRPSDTPGLFSATDNPATRRFYTLDARGDRRRPRADRRWRRSSWW